MAGRHPRPGDAAPDGSARRRGQPWLDAADPAAALMKSMNARSGAGTRRRPGIVEERPGEALPPGLEHRLQRAAVEMRPQPVLEQVRRCRCRRPRRRRRGRSPPPTLTSSGPVGSTRTTSPSRSNSQGGIAPLGEAAAQAGMAEQVARMLRPAVAVEIGRGGGGGEALDARADRHRDHVLLQPLVVADAGVAAGREHVDEAVLGDDLQPDVGIGGEERRHDARQHQPRRADRHVEPQRAGRPVAKAVDHVERRLDLGQRRAEPLQQARARLGRRDAARGAVEQPDAEPRLQPAHRLAQARRAAAAGARAVAKAAGARHRDEGVQVAEVGVHCSPLRTACADCARLSRSATAAYAVGGTQQGDATMTEHRHRPATFRLGDRTREAARLRRHAARRARRVRPAEGPRRRAGRAARGRRRAASTTSTPATSTARMSPTRSSARRCIPIRTTWSSSPRSAPGAATDGSWLPAFSPRRLTQAVHDNLRNLGLDVLDVVNLRMHARRPRPGRRIDRGAAHRAGRVAAARPDPPHRPPYVLFYGEGEAILGTATGVLVQHTSAAPENERAAAAAANLGSMEDMLSADVAATIGAVAWVVAILAAAIALRPTGAPLAVSLVLAVSAIAALHGPPIRPVGLLFFPLPRWCYSPAVTPGAVHRDSHLRPSMTSLAKPFRESAAGSPRPSSAEQWVGLAEAAS